MKKDVNNATADARKVGEREGEIYGLYHHGQDPDAPGYTFAELLHLSRSVVTPQRLTGFTCSNIDFRKTSINNLQAEI